MKSLTAEVDEVISKMAISWEWADPKRGLKSFTKREGLGCRKVSYSKFPSHSRKGNRLIFRCWILVRGSPPSPFGICLWQHKRTWSREKEAEAEISFLLKEVNREWRSAQGVSGQPGVLCAPPMFSKRVWNHDYRLKLSFLLKRTILFFVPPALFVPHENSRDIISFQSSRSRNRSRCPRCIVSSFEQNVCKGSRQNGSVTSG